LDKGLKKKKIKTNKQTNNTLLVFDGAEGGDGLLEITEIGCVE